MNLWYCLRSHFARIQPERYAVRAAAIRFTEKLLIQKIAHLNGKKANGKDDSNGTPDSSVKDILRRASQTGHSDDERIVTSENNDELSSLPYRIVPAHRNGSPDNATIEDGQEWLDRELERIYNTGSNDTSCHRGGVLSIHLDTMGSDNEAANYMDRVARRSASSASASLATSSTTATAAAPFSCTSSSSGHMRSSSGSCLGKRRRGSTDIGGETLTGGDCLTMTEDVDQVVSHDGGPEDEPSEKAKGKRPEGAISPRKKPRRREAINGYKKHMKMPEPFPHKRPSVSFKKGYSENLAKTLTAVTQELEELQPLSTGMAAASTAVTADTTATTDTVQPRPLVSYTQDPSSPPTRPLRATPVSQTVPSATAMQSLQSMEVVSPLLHPPPMQNIHSMLSLPPMTSMPSLPVAPPASVVSDDEMRSYQDMQAMHMRAIEDLQAMDPVQAMQGLPGMSGVADDIPLMPAIPIPDAMAHALRPIPPLPHGLPMPTYDHNTIHQNVNHDAAYTTGYNYVPPPPSLVPAGQGGLNSPEDEDYIEVDDYFGVAGPMDFTDPGEMHRFMSFCEELGTSHDVLDTTSGFQWI
uniref:Mating type protein n=1 Tax=Sporothrix globosa TaxID=545651 RepID=A0A059TBB8_9PEZI|nr:mating type protein [Sporothrix globosa]